MLNLALGFVLIFIGGVPIVSRVGGMVVRFTRSSFLSVLKEFSIYTEEFVQWLRSLLSQPNR